MRWHDASAGLWPRDKSCFWQRGEASLDWIFNNSFVQLLTTCVVVRCIRATAEYVLKPSQTNSWFEGMGVPTMISVCCCNNRIAFDNGFYVDVLYQLYYDRVIFLPLWWYCSHATWWSEKSISLVRCNQLIRSTRLMEHLIVTTPLIDWRFLGDGKMTGSSWARRIPQGIGGHINSFTLSLRGKLTLCWWSTSFAL